MKLPLTVICFALCFCFGLIVAGAYRAGDYDRGFRDGFAVKAGDMLCDPPDIIYCNKAWACSPKNKR